MATRFYFKSTGNVYYPLDDSGTKLNTLRLGPALAADAGWADAADMTRIGLPADTATSTAMATTAYSDGDKANTAHAVHQFISKPLAAQTISAQTVKFQMRALEANAGNNQTLAIGIRAINPNETVVGTLLAVTADDVEVDASTLTNRAFSATTTEVTVSDEDILIVEVGIAGDPAGPGDHTVDLRIGDSGVSDLPEDDTDTNDYNPWLEFTNTISFYSAGSTTVRTLIGGGFIEFQA